MNRRLPPLAVAATLVALLAPRALAEGPLPGPGGEEDPREIARRISRALKANEENLARLARGEKGDAKSVDIRAPGDCAECKNGTAMPADGSCESCGRKTGETAGGAGTTSGGAGAPGQGERASGGMDELLGALRSQGGAILSGIDDLLAQARRSQQSGGGGGGGDPNQPPQGGDDPQGKKKEPEGKQDPKPEDGGKDDPKQDEQKGGHEPRDGEDSRDPADPTARPPRSDKDPPSEEDLKSAFFARLPPKVREAVDNGDFDKVPEKYRALVAEWTRILAAKDAEDARKGN